MTLPIRIGAIKKQSRGNHLSSEGDEMTLPIRIGAVATTRRLERLGQDGDLDCSLLQRRAHLMGGAIKVHRWPSACNSVDGHLAPAAPRPPTPPRRWLQS